MTTPQDLSAFEQRKAEFKARAEARRAERAALEEQALKDGKLWTVMIAYRPHGAFALIYFGRVGDGMAEIFQSQHQSAHMFLEPTVVLGDKLHARQQACKMANTDEITIRVVGAPKNRITMPEVSRV